jgi:hypothetical protein
MPGESSGRNGPWTSSDNAMLQVGSRAVVRCSKPVKKLQGRLDAAETLEYHLA